MLAIKERGDPWGDILLVNTCTVLATAAREKYIPDRNTMRAVYKNMMVCDDGLVDISLTILLSNQTWAPK